MYNIHILQFYFHPIVPLLIYWFIWILFYISPIRFIYHAFIFTLFFILFCLRCIKKRKKKRKTTRIPLYRVPRKSVRQWALHVTKGERKHSATRISSSSSLVFAPRSESKRPASCHPSARERGQSGSSERGQR